MGLTIHFFTLSHIISQPIINYEINTNLRLTTVNNMQDYLLPIIKFTHKLDSSIPNGLKVIEVK